MHKEMESIESNRNDYFWIAVVMLITAGIAAYWMSAPDSGQTGAVHAQSARPLPSVAGNTAQSAGGTFTTASGSDSSSQTSVAALRDQITMLAGDLALLRQQVAAIAGRPLGSAAQDALHKPADAAGRAEAKRLNQQLAKTRDTAFHAEPVDAQWSSVTAAVLRRAFVAPDAASFSVGALDCRSKTCRVEVTGNGSGDLNEFLVGVAARMTDAASSVVVDPPDRDNPNAAVVLYFSR
jgi:hypothetical protein